MTRLVLASASPARLRLLRDAGVDPVVRVSAVDEPALLDRLPPAVRDDPVEHCMALARAKADDVAATLAREGFDEGALVIGCDSVLDLDGVPMGKPGSPAEALERWRAMRGREGVLRTGHAVVRVGDGARGEGVASTVVRFGTPDDEELAAYVATGEPLRVAGAFTLDGLGGPFVLGVDGDPSTVVGLSLPLLRDLLRGLGVRWTDLWRPDAHGRAPRPAT